MEIQTSRFGKIRVDENQIISFSGLLAFEELKRFCLLDIKESIFFKWMQSVENPEVAFVLVDPFVVKKDYYIDLNDKLKKELDIQKQEDVLIYTTVTIPHTGFKDATTNLVGPIIINWSKKKGKQIILEREDIVIKYPLSPNL